MEGPFKPGQCETNGFRPISRGRPSRATMSAVACRVRALRILTFRQNPVSNLMSNRPSGDVCIVPDGDGQARYTLGAFEIDLADERPRVPRDFFERKTERERERERAGSAGTFDI